MHWSFSGYCCCHGFFQQCRVHRVTSVPRRPFLISLSAMRGLSWPRGSKGKEPRKPDCTKDEQLLSACEKCLSSPPLSFVPMQDAVPSCIGGV